MENMRLKMPAEKLTQKEYCLYKALELFIQEERAKGVPVREVMLNLDAYGDYKGIMEKCSEWVGQDIDLKFNGVTISRGLATQFQPFKVLQVWAKTEDERGKQREELGMKQLN